MAVLVAGGVHAARGDESTELIEELETAEDELPIIFDAMALDWDQVTKIKDVIYDRCPAINSDELRENPDRHYTCPL